MAGFRDVVVLLPGITGSALANSEGKEVWGASAGVVWRAITSLGSSVANLQLAANGGPGGVAATRLIAGTTLVPGLVKIDGYRTIEEYLVRELDLVPGKNYLPFPYDWRLDNRVTAKRLAQRALDALHDWREESKDEDARLIFVAHSMGGLVARYFVECLGGWEHTRLLVTIGTPHWGSLNAVDFLVHGMKKGIGPLGIDLTPVLRSLPSIYQLLPNYACVDIGGTSLAGVADAVAKGHLAPIDEPCARDALAFHAEMDDAHKANEKNERYRQEGYRLVPIIGLEQPTNQSARCLNGKVEMLRSLNGRDDAGDGTVPRISAVPAGLNPQAGAMFAAEIHGSLQNADGALINLKGLLTSPNVAMKRLRRAGLALDLSLEIDDVILPGEPLTVRSRISEGNPRIDVQLTNVDTGQALQQEHLALNARTGWHEGQFNLPAGVWRVTVSAPNASPVTDLAVLAAS